MTADLPVARDDAAPSSEELPRRRAKSSRPALRGPGVAPQPPEPPRLQLAAPPGRRLAQLAIDLGTRIRRRPLGSLAVAIGIGFVAGGALTFRAGRLALAVTARRFAHELLKRLL
jgi:hypothetical protein